MSKILNFKSKLIIRCGYIASLNAKLYKKSFLWRGYTNLLELIAFCCANKIFIAGEGNGDYLKAKYEFLRKKFEILNNGIDTDIFKPLVSNKKFDIGYVGRLEKDKNLLNLLEAIKGKELSVCFIGQGEEKNKLKEYAIKNGISLEIIDKIDNFQLPIFYNQFKVFALPSLHEGNPKSLLEALSCGFPVLACNVVGVNSIIKDGDSGILTNTDAESIRSGLEKIMKDDALRRRISNKGRRLIEENYSLNKILQKETEIYEEMVG
jgi:glycosyltransferase involved in cell wall biosynthesis